MQHSLEGIDEDKYQYDLQRLKSTDSTVQLENISHNIFFFFLGNEVLDVIFFSVAVPSGFNMISCIAHLAIIMLLDLIHYLASHAFMKAKV